MPSRSQSSWVPQQVAIDYQRNDLLRRELDRIFGREQYRIHGVWLSWNLSKPSADPSIRSGWTTISSPCPEGLSR
ncbi:hypothetical protein CGCSCA4_v011269 [Colletotrichum siamense]|uniref:Uncharacterized protein n=1 Tax=Colletotrichum siamense TaxID=690259 RepID=A0A9P5K132_COLSI|nr:hypothetical protein CGCSCA4_v011269 [Colletotrichum siamense]KAF4853237.1 hypothetical protein CGCSCA2_v010056 [Colletotrichum siamense]